MRLVFSLFFVFSFTSFSYSQGYRGDGLLNVLGQIKDSTEGYLIFAREWGLGRKTSLPEKGFKISRNSETQRVTALFFAGKGFEVGNTKFEKFSGEMPFGLSMDDAFDGLVSKLGAPQKSGDEYGKFTKNGLNIFAKFKNKSRNKLEYIKIALGFGQLVYSPFHQEPDDNSEEEEEVAVSKSLETPKPPSNTSDTKQKVVITETMPADFSGTSNRMNTNTLGATKSPFYRAVMKAMRAGSEAYFETLRKGDLTPIPNFWNYKYTYQTSLKIPGEKYNFIYNFPFATSQRDFVSVFKEGVYDSNFKVSYENLMVMLKAEFPTSEGWKYSYPKDEDSTYPLKDFEVQNERFGSIVLDYHKKPSGESVLYLRLLLYYD